MNCLGLEHAAESDEAFSVVVHRKFVNAHTATGSVDEGHISLFGVHFLDEAHVAHSFSHAGSLEEDEVARFQFRQFLDFGALGPLDDGTAAQFDVLLAIDEAGEARAIECMRSRGAVAVARTDIFHGMVNQLTAFAVLVFGRFVGQRLCQNWGEEGEGEQDGCQESFECHVVYAR